MSPDQPHSPTSIATEIRRLVERLNTALELAHANRITAHLEISEGRIRWASKGVTQRQEEKTLWSPEEAEHDDT